jgi:hypothetical protein
MRTRLDEIVEEEIRAVDTAGEMTSPAARILHEAYRNVARKIAERSFRHGVERAIDATTIITGHTFDFDGKGWMDAVLMGVAAARVQMVNVQPAPPCPCDCWKCKALEGK